MAPRRALDLALDLERMPMLAAAMRRQPLPADVVHVIRLAAGSPDAIQAAAEATGRSARHLKAISILYLQQMLFFPEADAFRTLGVLPTTPKDQTRQHLRWLLQWLHPDHNSDPHAALLTDRVIKAWIEVRDEQPFAAMLPAPKVPDRSLNKKGRRVRPGRSGPKIPWIGMPIEAPRSKRKLHVLGALLTLCALSGLAIFELAPASAWWSLWSVIGGTKPILSAQDPVTSGWLIPVVDSR